MEKGSKHCSNCTYSIFIPMGFDLEGTNIPKIHECCNTLVDYTIMEMHEWDPNVLPLHCGHYDPALIEACYECKKPIGEPWWSWGIWAEIPIDYAPTCSERCRKKLKRKMERELFGDG